MPCQFLGFEGVHADRDRVGSADFDGRDVVEAIQAADGGVDGAGRRVQGGDGGSDYGVAVTVRDQAVEGCACHSLGHDQPGQNEADTA